MRKTSEVTDTSFPFNVYDNPLNTYMAVYKTGEVKVLGRYKNDLEDNLMIMMDVKEGLADMYVSWVGRYRTDVFIVDNIDDMRKANIR